MSEFDQASRFAAKQLDIEGFLSWLLPELAGKWRWLDWLDTQTVPFPGEPDKRCDTIATFEHSESTEPPCAFVIEMQSAPKREALKRGTRYVLQLETENFYQNSAPRVPYLWGLIILNLTGLVQSGEWIMNPGGVADIVIGVNARILTLSEMDADGILNRIEAGELSWAILVWVALMAGADQPPLIARWRSLADMKAPAQMRGELAGLVKVFADLANRKEVWRAGLESWNVMKSTVVEEWRAEGRVEARQESLLELLGDRFGTVPDDVVAFVQANDQQTILRQWQSLAAKVHSIDEFRVRIHSQPESS